MLQGCPQHTLDAAKEFSICKIGFRGDLRFKEYEIIETEDFMNVFEKARKQAKALRIQYPKDARIELIKMGNDPRPIPDGIKGTVKGVDDMGRIAATMNFRLQAIPKS